MTLRTRLLLSASYLMLLIVVSAGGAAIGFHHLGRGIDRVLRNNFESVRFGLEMLESLERQDSATLALLLEGGATSPALDEADSAFATALAGADANVTEVGEETVVAEIERTLAIYRAARSRLLSEPSPRPLAAYEGATFPAFAAVKAAVRALLDANHRAMVEADRRARSIAQGASIALGGLAGLALLSMGFLFARLEQDVLGRLADMKQVAVALEAGEAGRRARVTRLDELGVVARQLNIALDAREEVERRERGRLASHRQMILALLDRLPLRAALVGLDGVLVASTLPELDTARVEAAEEELSWEGRGKLLLGGDAGAVPRFEVASGPGSLLAEGLFAAGVRPVGWLVTAETRLEPGGRRIER